MHGCTLGARFFRCTEGSTSCVDGAYSYSQSRRGTCSGHGGVATWL
ncbi:DUF3761 domain-containing protein [Curtobacterium sp. BRB10]